MLAVFSYISKSLSTAFYSCVMFTLFFGICCTKQVNTRSGQTRLSFMALFLNSRGLLLGVYYSRMTSGCHGQFVYFQQVKEIVDSYPQLWLPEGKLSHCLYRLVNYMLISFLHLTTFIQLSFVKLHLFIACLQNVLYFNVQQEQQLFTS